MDRTGTGSHVIDLCNVRGKVKPAVTVKLVIVVGSALGLFLLVQILLLFRLDTSRESKRHQMEVESRQHIHPEILDLTVSKAGRVAFGRDGDKSLKIMHKVSQISNENILPCDAECQRFREVMSLWPPGKPKAAIVILTQISRVHQLRTLLEALDSYFLNTITYPVVIFHEENYRLFREEVRKWTQADVFFQEVNFQIPDFIDPSAVPKTACLKGMGAYVVRLNSGHCSFEFITFFRPSAAVRRPHMESCTCRRHRVLGWTFLTNMSWSRDQYYVLYRGVNTRLYANFIAFPM